NFLFNAELCFRPCHGEELRGQQDQRPSESTRHEDYDMLVASLANKNLPPKIVGEVPHEKAMFPDDYDWSEHQRVLKVIQQLVENFEEALPSLVAHLQDDRHCMTFRYEATVQNHTISKVCQMLIIDNLIEPYIRFSPDGKIAYLELSK